MPNNFIILPMFAMVVLTFTTLVLLFLARTGSVKRGELGAGFFKTYQGQTEPETNLKMSRHFVNLFESPVLFYAACLGALATQLATTSFQIIAWIYVMLRIIHAFVHMGANKLPFRIAAYFTSWAALLLLWGILAFNVMVAR